MFNLLAAGFVKAAINQASSYADELRDRKTMNFKWISASIAILTTFSITFILADVLLSQRSAGDQLQQRLAALGRLFNQPAVTPDVHTPLAGTRNDMILSFPSLRQPPVESASNSRLLGQTPVIGVSVGNKFRAYPYRDLALRMVHVVNDLMGNIPVSVTYCDRTDCARVLTQAGRTEPLDVFTCGFIAGQMAMQIEKQVFAHDSQEIPLEDLNFIRTTWGDWKDAHPETDVVIGDYLLAGPLAPAD